MAAAALPVELRVNAPTLEVRGETEPERRGGANLKLEGLVALPVPVAATNTRTSM